MLIRLAARAGLDSGDAAVAVGSSSHATGPSSPDGFDELDRAIHADIEEAASLGISGVPFFVLAGKYGISGAQPAEVFESALAQVWDELHPEPGPLTPIALPGEPGAACGTAGCD